MSSGYDSILADQILEEERKHASMMIAPDPNTLTLQNDERIEVEDKSMYGGRIIGNSKNLVSIGKEVSIEEAHESILDQFLGEDFDSARAPSVNEQILSIDSHDR